MLVRAVERLIAGGEDQTDRRGDAVEVLAPDGDRPAHRDRVVAIHERVDAREIRPARDQRLGRARVALGAKGPERVAPRHEVRVIERRRVERWLAIRRITAKVVRDENAGPVPGKRGEDLLRDGDQSASCW